MIINGDLIKYTKEKMQDFYYEELTDSIVRKSDGFKIPFAQHYEEYCKATGQSFECIYDFHAECMSIQKCTECGTYVKFYSDEREDLNFKCPKCTNYKGHYPYWTKEEFENDPNIQAIIKMCEQMAIDDDARYKRSQERCGLEDWQLTKRINIYFKKTGYIFELDIDSITNKNKLKGLKLKIEKLKKDEVGWIYENNLTIPLSISALHCYLIRKPYLKKHPE